MPFREEIERREIHDVLQDFRADELPWNHHPEFEGVRLKHILTGKNTENHFSYHLVHVEAGCEMSSHIHETQIELHQVIEGRGTGQRGDEHIAYQAGVTAVMPQSETHAVKADEDLYMLATFIPPLV